MSTYIPLVEYKGVQIQVDTEVGKFMCYLDDNTMVEERTLSTVRKRIDNAEPVAKVMMVSTEHWVRARATTYSQSELVRVGRQRLQNALTHDKPLTDDMVVPGYYELYENLLSDLAQLDREQHDETEAVKEKYEAMKREVAAQAVPLTYGTLRALLEENRRAKAGRR